MAIHFHDEGSMDVVMSKEYGALQVKVQTQRHGHFLIGLDHDQLKLCCDLDIAWCG